MSDDQFTAQLAALEAELKDIKVTLAFIEEQIVKSSNVIDKVSAEVMPTINSLMESPMLKMLGMRKK